MNDNRLIDEKYIDKLDTLASGVLGYVFSNTPQHLWFVQRTKYIRQAYEIAQEMADVRNAMLGIAGYDQHGAIPLETYTEAEEHANHHRVDNTETFDGSNTFSPALTEERITSCGFKRLGVFSAEEMLDDAIPVYYKHDSHPMLFLRRTAGIGDGELHYAAKSFKTTRYDIDVFTAADLDNYIASSKDYGNHNG